jgi:hypothetical protein
MTNTTENPKTKTMNKIAQLITFGLVALSFGVIDSVATSLYWKHLAIKHNAATYESNSWGIPSFHWNDVSFAQAPFQDEGWEKVQNTLFTQKLNALGLK